jgi:hypothetical protein
MPYIILSNFTLINNSYDFVINKITPRIRAFSINSALLFPLAISTISITASEADIPGYFQKDHHSWLYTLIYIQLFYTPQSESTPVNFQVQKRG